IMYRGGTVYFLIGVAAIASGLAYTGGPYPLGYHGWGEFFVLIFFGPVAVCGTYYLMAYEVPPEVQIASVAPGLFSVAILTVNNMRDIGGDRKAGKRTLAARFGKGFARVQYVASLLGGAIGAPLYLTTQTVGHRWALLGAASVLVAIPNLVIVFRYQ